MTSVVKRLLKIIGWSVGVLVLIIGLAGVAAYVFVTSDFVRAQIERHAVSGRKTKVARISETLSAEKLVWPRASRGKQRKP